ncbi:TPR repeat domain-containing protein [Chloropicon primus]|nr:TPR repeat domain-containing protein [Chloropicon primus]
MERNRPRGLGAKDLGAARAPRAKHLEDEETSRDLFGVVRCWCTVPGCECRQYVKKTCEYTVQPEEYGKRLHPHNDVTITNCSVCGHKCEDHAVDSAMNEKETGNDSFDLGNYDEAVLSYSRGIAHKPHDATLWSNRAAAYLAKGMYDQALHDAARAVEISPEWAKGRARKALAHYQLKQFDKAAREYQVCLKLEPDNEKYAQGLASARKGLATAAAQPRRNPKKMGDDHMRGGDFTRAIECYTEAAKKDPRDCKVFSNRSAAYARRSMYKEALADAINAIRLAPNWPKAWSRKGYALYHTGKMDEAIFAYEHCLLLDPSDKDVRKLLMQMKASRASPEAPESGNSKEESARPGDHVDKPGQGGATAEQMCGIQASLGQLMNLVKACDARLQKQSETMSNVLQRVEGIEKKVEESQRKVGGHERRAGIDVRQVVGGSHSKSSSLEQLDIDINLLQEKLVKERTLRQVAEVAAEEDLSFLREQMEAVLKEKAGLAQDNARLAREGSTMAKQLEILEAQMDKGSDLSQKAKEMERRYKKEKAARLDAEERAERAEKSLISSKIETDAPKFADIDFDDADTDGEPDCTSSEHFSDDFVSVRAESSSDMSTPEENACSSKESGAEEEDTEAPITVQVEPERLDSEAPPEGRTSRNSSVKDEETHVKVSADNLLTMFQGLGHEATGAKASSSTSHVAHNGEGEGIRGPPEDLKEEFQKCVEVEYEKLMATGEHDPQEAAIRALSAAKENVEGNGGPPRAPSSPLFGEDDVAYYDQNAKDDACQVFEDVWNALADEKEEEEDQGEGGGDEQRWFDLQEEWSRVKEFCDSHRDVVKPPSREKRPLHETAKPLRGLASDRDAVLDITNIAQNMKTVSQRSLQRDWFGVVRGACKICEEGGERACESFKPSFQGCQTPQRLFERAVKEKDSDLMEFALKWNTFPAGKFCATCGYACELHETEEEFAKRLRIDAIVKRKQEDILKSKESEMRERENECQKRVKEAVLRQKEADANGEYIRETSLDFITQVRRGRCLKNSDCPGFKVIYRESDALNPEIMLYCSLCGHPSSEHPVDADWVDEQKRKRERESAQQARSAPRFRSVPRRTYDGQSEAKRSARRLLGLKKYLSG